MPDVRFRGESEHSEVQRHWLQVPGHPAPSEAASAAAVGSRSDRHRFAISRLPVTPSEAGEASQSRGATITEGSISELRIICDTPAGIMPAGCSGFPLVGTPEQIVEKMLMLSRNGLDGTALSFVNYQEELPQFIADVVPLMEQVELRSPYNSAK